MTELSRRSFLGGAATAIAGTAAGSKVSGYLTKPEAAIEDTLILDTAIVTVNNGSVSVSVRHDGEKTIDRLLADEGRPYNITFAACNTTGTVLAVEQVDAVTALNDTLTAVQVPLPIGDEKRDGGHPIRYVALLETEAQGLVYLGETDAYVVDGQLRQRRPDSEVATVTRDGFKRQNENGHYTMKYTWNETGSLSLDIGKTRYEIVAQNHDRRAVDTYHRAVENPLLERLGNRITERTTDEVSAAEGVVALAQGLTYYHDRTTDGSMEYPKYAEETLVDGGGDCEDKATLMAGIFEQPPFNYDTIMLFPPTHAAIGVAARDLPDDSIHGDTRFTVGGTEYVYVESTGDVQIGETDSSYEGQPVAAYTGSGWARLRPAGIARFAVDAARQFITGTYD